MKIVPCCAVGIVGILALADLTPAARAQTRGQPFVARSSASRYARLAQPGFVRLPAPLYVQAQTSVSVPDGGSVVLGGFSQAAEGWAEFGAPVLGRTPYAGRGFRNAGYGRDAVSARVSARVRIIDLREEEFRQTGVRSP